MNRYTLGLWIACGVGACQGSEPASDVRPVTPPAAEQTTPVVERAVPPPETKPAELPIEPTPVAAPVHDDPPLEPVASASKSSITLGDPPQAAVATTLTLPDGARLQVAAEVGADQSIVWAQSLAPASPAVALRKTSGVVHGIAAAFDGVTLWVGWRSTLAGKNSILGVAGFDRALKLTKPPRILRSFEDIEWDAGKSVRMVARPGTGAGVTVAAMVGAAPCRGLFPGENDGPASCPRIEVAVLDGDGARVRSEFRPLDGGDGDFVDLIDVGDGVVSSFFAWHGGGEIDVAFVPYAKELPVRRLGSCGYPPVDLAWVDGELLTVCPDPTGEGTCTGRASADCGFLHRGALQDAPAAGKEFRFHGWKQGCKGGLPVIRLSWVTDPRQPDITPGQLDVPADALASLAKPGEPGKPCKGPALQ